MAAVVWYFFTLPAIERARRTYRHNRFWREIAELHAELEGSEGSEGVNFGRQPKESLVKGRRTLEDEWRWWCEFLSKKHEECAKLNESDEPLCDVFKNGWLKDCATLDAKPKQVFFEGRSILGVKSIAEDYYFSGGAN